LRRGEGRRVWLYIHEEERVETTRKEDGELGEDERTYGQ
jgi:hypothetical protein